MTVEQQHRGSVARESHEQAQVIGINHRLAEAIEHAQSLSPLHSMAEATLTTTGDSVMPASRSCRGQLYTRMAGWFGGS